MATGMIHIVPYAIDLGISSASAASILAAVGGLTVVGNIVLGSAGDRIGSRQVFIISLILMSAALFWAIPSTQTWMLYLFAVVFGFAHAGCTTLESPLVAGLFGLRSHGLILGVLCGGLTVGSSLGPLLAGHIFDVTGSYHLAFLVCAALVIIGSVLTALVKPVKGRTG